MDAILTLKKEIFKEVWDKAEAQSFVRSLENGDETSCAYRAAYEGKTIACNVGHLIPDDKYSPTIEGTSVGVEIFKLTTAYSRANERGLTDDGIEEIHTLLIELQEVHDEANSANEHREGLIRYGARKELIEAQL